VDPDRDHIGDDLGVRETDLEAVLARGEGPPGGVGIVDELKGLAVDVPDDLLGRWVDCGAEGKSGHRLGSLGIGEKAEPVLGRSDGEPRYLGKTR
jgi:hypothetical protein